jgi:hypothetical protein
MRAFVIFLLVVAASPALSQTQAEKPITAEKTEAEKTIETEKAECLTREVRRLMQPHKAYSLALVSDIVSDAAHICRHYDPAGRGAALEQQAHEILYSLLPPDQKDFLNKAVEHMFQEPGIRLPEEKTRTLPGMEK